MTDEHDKPESNQLGQTTKLNPRAAMPMYDRDDMDREGDVPWRIGLHLVDADHTLEIEIGAAVTLGRQGLDTFDYPHHNLTQYGAQQAGVSRVHARLSVTKQGVAIHDLSSTNGTLLNGYRLEPFTDVSLQDGDEIELGRLRIRITFMDSQN
ncbi:MAG: FHA domain-containing protein [Chloroflexota bacterium]